MRLDRNGVQLVIFGNACFHFGRAGSYCLLYAHLVSDANSKDQNSMN
jgi:hypothetical protein